MVKIRNLSSPLRQTTHQNTTSGGDGTGVKDGERQKGKAMEMEQMFFVAVDLWPDKTAAIDGLLVGSGPCVSCFQND